MEWLKVLIGFTPVVIFLLFLMVFDSFKLVSERFVIKAMLLGGLAAISCFLINQWLYAQLQVRFYIYTNYWAPLVEELFKSLIIIYYLRRAKIGFLIDAAIIGFAAGTGFAIIENIDRFRNFDLPLADWILRGFGTAVMHGATTALFAIISKYFIDRFKSTRLYLLVPGLILALSIHSIFNQLLFWPEMLIFAQLILLPAFFFFIFISSEKALYQWLDINLDAEVGLLSFLNSGKISRSRVGEYFEGIKDVFPGEKIADMLCYLKIYLELTVRAKGLLLMQQNGFSISLDGDVEEKLKELKFLEISIGKTGKRAMAAIFRADPLNLWQINLLKDR